MYKKLPVLFTLFSFAITGILKRWSIFSFSKSGIFVLFFICFGSKNIQAQETNKEFALLNVGVSSLIGGVGAVINKEPNQKFGKVLLKGLAQGALGGYVVFESKRILRPFAQTENYTYIWSSKIVNAAGNSIIENAASNRNFWEQWHINFGFNRFDIYTQDGFKLKYRIMPFMLGQTVGSLFNYKFDALESLKLGTIVVKGDVLELDGRTNINAGAAGNIIYIKPSTGLESRSHELVHTYQYEQFSGVNMYIKKPLNRLEEKSGILKWYNKYFYTDWNILVLTGLYSINPEFEKNVFEREAQFFKK